MPMWWNRSTRGTLLLDSRVVECEDVVYLSLSRLNQRLPGYETHPEVVQGAAEFHHQSADALLPQAEPVFDDTTTLDTAVDMLDALPTVVQGLIGSLLFPCQLLAARVIGGPEDLH